MDEQKVRDIYKYFESDILLVENAILVESDLKRNFNLCWTLTHNQQLIIS
jgi:hypothetical protein